MAGPRRAAAGRVVAGTGRAARVALRSASRPPFPYGASGPDPAMPIVLHGGAQILGRDHPGPDEAGQVVRATVALRLEIAGASAHPFRQLRHDAPGEVLEAVRGRVPRREDGGPEALDVARGVADDRPNVMGRHDPAHTRSGRPVAEGSQDEDDA